MDVTIPKSLATGSVNRASVASYYNNLGVLTYAPNNTARVDYIPSNLAAAPNLLLEGAMQPALSLMTEGFNGTFTFSNSAIYPNAFLAPDGTYTASYLSEDVTNSVHSMTSSVLLVSGSAPSSAFSIYARANITDNNDRHAFTIEIFNTDTVKVLFDLTTQTATILTPSGTSPNLTCKLVPINNGWFRCVINDWVTGVGNIKISLYNGSETYTGDGHSGLYFWGAQFEAGKNETSYYPSTQAFVSRTGPIARYINSSGLITTSSGGRLNYSPANLAAFPKLLLEKAGSNLLLQSAQFNVSPWVQNTVTVANSVTGSPQIAPTTANTEGSKITDASGSVAGYVSQSVTVPNDNNQYVFSVYIAKTTGATVFPGLRFTYTGGAAIDASVIFNTNNGTYGRLPSGAGLDYVSVQSLPAFWRVSIGLANNSSGNTSLEARIYPAVNSTTTGTTFQVALTGDVIVWGSQVEQGASETSFIQNTSTILVRGADVFTVGNSPSRAADITSLGLLYTNIPENDFPVWSAATTYGIDVSGNNSVIYNHVKYASLQASNTNHVPSTSPTWWSVIGPTNAYAMIDSQVGTQTIGAVGGSIIAFLNIGAVNSINFINVSADYIDVKVYTNNILTYSTVIDFTGGTSGIPITDYTVTDLTGTASDTYVRLQIGSASAAPAIGNFVAGTKYYIGSTESSPTVGITDYSIKTVDAFGNPTLTKRGYAKRMNTKQILDDAQVDFVARLMAQVRATPCVWNANTTLTEPNSNKKTSLIVYGYYKDWEIDVAYTNKSYLSATIEGLL